MYSEKKLVVICMFFFLASSLFLTHAGAEKVSSETISEKPNAERSDGENPSKQKPEITIDVPSHDVGEIYEGESIVHSFSVKNTGNTTLNIERVKAG